MNPPMWRIGAWCIITMMEYLKRWVKVAPVKDCTIEISTWFIFESIITRFGCPKVLMSDH